MITWHVGDKVICRSTAHRYLIKNHKYTIAGIRPLHCEDEDDSLFESFVINLKELPKHEEGFWI